MECRGCNRDRKLVKAHIIPESFFRGFNKGKGIGKIFTNIQGIFPKRSPIGIYDSTILCAECESVFQDLDDYGYRTLILEEDNLEPINDNGLITGYIANGVDTNLLKIFFISVLWRASISNQDFYSKVSLGELEDAAKCLVWQKSSGGDHDFSFVLARFSEGRVGRVMLDPHPEEWEGVNYYRFYLYGYVLYIKADLQDTPGIWSRFISNNDTLFLVSRGKFSESNEFPVVADTLQMQMQMEHNQ